MENKCYRSSINSIPKDQSNIKSSNIPLFFSVEFHNEEHPVPFVSEELVRCDKCKAYLNPYAEIISPGFKWKCNLCENVNDVAVPFQMSERKSCENPRDPLALSAFNKAYFIREDLRNDVYELEAPDMFNVSTPDQPVICFLIDVSAESLNINLLSSVMSSTKEILRSQSLDPRTKICYMFFSDSVYILNTNKTISVVAGEAPMMISEKILFSIKKEDENSVFSIDFDLLESYFQDRKTASLNYLLALKICVQAFRSASLFSFISNYPNTGEGKVEPSVSLNCTNQKYKEVADSLVRKNLCSNLFVMARSNVELSSLKIPSQYTGGQILHYPNFDGSDIVSTSKFYCDLVDYINRESNTGAVCRIRCNDGIILKDVFGNFFQKGADLLSYSNFNPAHNINFTLGYFNDVKNALHVQVAMAKVNKSGKKYIRVANIMIPKQECSFYETCDANAIAHSLCLEAFYKESKKKLAGNAFLENRVREIINEVKAKHGRIPDNLYNLPTLVNALMKTIPFRPDLSTPIDFRSYYIYMLSNYRSKIVDLIIYPLLLNITSENVAPLPLSFNSIDQSSILLLDAGSNIFFYVGKDCNKDLASSLFDNLVSGPVLFNPAENEFSNYVSELMTFVLSNRPVKPRFILCVGEEVSIYNEIFFSHLYDDAIYNLPSSVAFRNQLEK